MSEATVLRIVDAPYIFVVADDDCPTFGDCGRIGRHNGETVYCACRAGIAAELADRDRVLSHIADALESMPVAESNKVERRTLWAHFSILREEYDQIERSRWMAVAT